MDKKKLTATSSSASGGSMRELFTSSKGASIRQPPDERMVQNVRLIWLDNNIDVTQDDDCRDTIAQLRRVVNRINTFTDADQCMTSLSEIQEEKVCMILSGSLGQNIAPLVQKKPQVDSVFIFCGNKSVHEKWASNFSKIRGVFTEISPICDTLKSVVRHSEQNTISISFMPTSGISNKNSASLDSSFKYTLILTEILITIKFEQRYFNEFIDFCQKKISEEYVSANLQKFTQEYRDKTPIWWYTHETFLYSMLNRAVRVKDMDIIIRMGFFVGDLHRHIKQLHEKQLDDGYYKNSLEVFRGQGLSKTDLAEMKKTKDGLMSFNNFLSTTKNRDVAMGVSRRTLTTPDLIGVLFVITIDPSISSTSFASIAGLSYDENREDEVLFSMHVVFRICDIKKLNENKDMWQVDLTLTSDSDPDLRDLTDRIRKETSSDLEGWYRFSELLFKMDQPDEAREVYDILLEQTPSDREKARLYHQIGWINDRQGNKKEAIKYYEGALELNIRILPPNHPLLATSYNSIGLVYRTMEEHSKALSSFEEAIEIYQNIPRSNHPDLISLYYNIALEYEKMNNHKKALESYKRAMEIGQQSLRPDHPHLQELKTKIKEVKKKS